MYVYTYMLMSKVDCDVLNGMHMAGFQVDFSTKSPWVITSLLWYIRIYDREESEARSTLEVSDPWCSSLEVKVFLLASHIKPLRDHPYIT